MALIIGNTFPVKDQLKALGGKWDPASKGWVVPDSKKEEAEKIMATVGGVVKKKPRPANWRPCGYPGCSPNYCDECDGVGFKERWGYNRNGYDR